MNLHGWRLGVLAAAWLAAAPVTAASQCYGTVSNGRLADGVKLPLDGPNFSAYSVIAATAGRTYVHSTTASIVTDAYAALEAVNPGIRYVYGETGLREGGRFAPHRTHRNGLSVDFFVPVRDRQGRSVPLPTSLAARFGYDLEFSERATSGEHRIDFEALAEHLYRLDLAARKHNARIAQVIFDRQYLPRLFATARGKYVQGLTFMKGKPWVRHDEHYHVDFALACEPR